VFIFEAYLIVHSAVSSLLCKLPIQYTQSTQNTEIIVKTILTRVFLMMFVHTATIINTGNKISNNHK